MADLREKLKQYEDLEEQGLLLRLKFPLGTKIFFVDDENVRVDEYIVNGMRGVNYTVEEPEDIEENVSYLCLFPPTEIGETVFLTKSEAEQKLKEMERD